MHKKSKQKETELIYGLHPIIELCKAKRRRLAILYTTKPTPKSWNMLSPFLPKGIQIQYVSREVLYKLSGTPDHQSLVGYSTPFGYRKKFFNVSLQPFLLMLDGIQDVRNLGAILRTAYCTGVNGVIITQRSSAPLDAAAFKASAGLAEHLDIYLVPTAKAAIQLLDKAGYTIYLSVPDQSANVASTVAYKKPLCLIIGSEGTGISHEILKSGTRIYLPQKEPDISYNASVAAGILLFLMATKLQII
jgi:23S rRNA (guanosine2251-2'-O)-methyltransferase